MELWEEIVYTTNTMEKAIRELKERGRANAESEYKYRVLLSQRLLALRSENTPVTIIGDIARGEIETAKLKMDRDISEVLYKSCLEGINVYKVKVKILEAQYQREWGASGREK